MEEDQYSEYRELAADFAETLVNVGLINSISGKWPTEVQERWHERLREMREWAHEQTSQAQDFASAYD